MVSGDIDSLFANPKRWVDGVTPDAVAWLEQVAAAIRERGQQPRWAQVYFTFAELFPGQAPQSVDTVKDTVRRMV